MPQKQKEARRIRNVTERHAESGRWKQKEKETEGYWEREEKERKIMTGRQIDR